MKGILLLKVVDSIVIENLFDSVAFVQVIPITYCPGKPPFSTLEVQVSSSLSKAIFIFSFASGYQ